MGRIEVNWGGDSYESLISAIIYQQISGSAGDSIEKKFKSLYNGKMPSPKKFLETPENKVRSAGISPQKYSYLKDLCTRIIDGRLELKKFDSMEDEDIIEELDEVRGIGRWTAEMFLMFSLGRTNIVPRDDLGIKKAIKNTYCLRDYPTGSKFSELAEKWAPYGTIASLYLWRSTDVKTPKKIE
jgi:DNA-3-methyladenine glycosylase II